MRPTINSRKHIVQNSLTTVPIGTISQQSLAIAQEPPDVDGSTDVVIGSTIKAVYLEYWVTGDDAASISSAVITLQKYENNAGNMTYAESVALHEYNNKKNVLYVSQGLVSQSGGTPLPLVRQWIKIPKGKQRFARGDLLKVTWSGISDGINICGLAIYKEYY